MDFKCEGTYLLLFHFDVGVRFWATQLVQKLGRVTMEDWEVIKPVLKLCMSILLAVSPSPLALSPSPTTIGTLTEPSAVLEFEMFDDNHSGGNSVSVALTRSR